MWFFSKPATMPTEAEALPGRSQPTVGPLSHAISGRQLRGPYPDGTEIAEFALGCFWGEEKTFWQVPGVWVTAVGYQGGYTPNPTYSEVCTGKTGHAEAVRVVYDPAKVTYEQLLKVFWESHDPTQEMRQGNDVGTQYRSAIFVHTDEQRRTAEASRELYQERLAERGFGTIATEIVGPPAPTFFFAEEYHQQYLDKNPNGYCPDHSTGVSCPIGVGVKAD
jgi:peptide-methionine (S)-S-oxide reductase